MPGSSSNNPHSFFSFFGTSDGMELTEQNELTAAPLFLLAVFNTFAVNTNTDLMESTRVHLLLSAVNIPNNFALDVNTHLTELDGSTIEPSLLLANNSAINDSRDGETHLQVVNAGGIQLPFFTSFNASMSEEFLTKSSDNSETSEACLINSH